PPRGRDGAHRPLRLRDGQERPERRQGAAPEPDEHAARGGHPRPQPAAARRHPPGADLPDLHPPRQRAALRSVLPVRARRRAPDPAHRARSSAPRLFGGGQPAALAERAAGGAPAHLPVPRVRRRRLRQLTGVRGERAARVRGALFARGAPQPPRILRGAPAPASAPPLRADPPGPRAADLAPAGVHRGQRLRLLTSRAPALLARRRSRKRAPVAFPRRGEPPERGKRRDGLTDESPSREDAAAGPARSSGTWNEPWWILRPSPLGRASSSWKRPGSSASSDPSA